MRQRRWLEVNALEIVYHHKKMNNVVDALSKISRVSLNANVSVP